MTFEYRPNELCAVDEEIGLRIETDFTFYDSTEVPLKLRDIRSGDAWTFRCDDISGLIVCQTPDGPTEIQTTISATVPRREIERLLPHILRALRRRGREPDVTEAFDVMLAGLFEFLSRGGVMLRFVPDFKVTWS